MLRVISVLSYPTDMFLIEVEQGNTPYFNFHIANKCLFSALSSAMCFYISVLHYYHYYYYYFGHFTAENDPQV